MKYIATIILLIPTLLFAQNESDMKKRLSILTGTSQGISFLRKETFSHTTKKTFPVTPGYTYLFFGGVNIDAKKGNSFSELKLAYHSKSNGIDSIIDIDSPTGVSPHTSRDRFKYLSLSYRYSRYIKESSFFNAFKKTNTYKTFYSAEVQVSYILNQRKTLNYENGSTVMNTKGKNISDNFILPTSPTFILSYGIEFNKGILNVGKKSRLSIDFAFDTFTFGIISSPSNQYFSTMLSYRLLI